MKKPKVWKLRCVACKALRFAAEFCFCTPGCSNNGKYARLLPKESMREEEYVLVRSRPMTSAIWDWGNNGPSKA